MTSRWEPAAAAVRPPGLARCRRRTQRLRRTVSATDGLSDPGAGGERSLPKSCPYAQPSLSTWPALSRSQPPAQLHPAMVETCTQVRQPQIKRSAAWQLSIALGEHTLAS